MLFVVCDGEPILQQLDATAAQHLLKLWNRSEKFFVLLVRAKPHHPLNASAVVPTAVEQNNLASRRQVCCIALKVPLCAFTVVGRGKCGHPTHAWVEPLGDALDDPAFAQAVKEFDGKVRNWKLRGLLFFVILTTVAVGSIWGIYSYTQTRYYLGVEDGKVAIYQGIKESFAGFGFSHLIETSELDLVSLPDFQQDLLNRSVSADSLADAKDKLAQIASSVDNG